MFLSLSEVKSHLIVDETFTADDNYLVSLIVTAEATVENIMDRQLSDLQEDGLLPTPILHAIKLLVANWYENREPLSSTNLHKNAYGVEPLLGRYKKYTY